MLNVNLKNQKFCVFGLQGSGKTVLARHILTQKFKRPLVYCFHEHDWNRVRAYRWHPPRDENGFVTNMEEDFKEFIKQGIILGRRKKIDLIMIDEADMFFQSNFQVREYMNDLVLNHRHYNVAVGFVSRRPQDIPTKIVESCKAGFYFALEGDNVLKKLKNISPKLMEEVMQLQHGDHHFLVKEIGKQPVKHKPIPL